MSTDRLILAARLETPRLILRSPEEADAPDVQDVHRHRQVADGVLSIPHPCPADHASGWIRTMRERRQEGKLFVWVLELRDTGRVVGDCGIEIAPEHRRGEIGYLLHPDRWGQGLMTESLRRLLRHVFTEIRPPLARVGADVFPENNSSLRLCERLGMNREGVLRGYYCKDGMQRDAVRSAILRDDFLYMEART